MAVTINGSADSTFSNGININSGKFTVDSSTGAVSSAAGMTLAGAVSGITTLAASGAISGILSSNIKLGTLTRVMNVATGNVSYTGVGFQPSRIVFFAGFSAAGWSAAHSYGFDDGASPKNINIFNAGAGLSSDTNFSINLIDDGATLSERAKIASFDSDGFTLSWTLLGAGNAGTANIHYLAIR